MKTYKQKDLGYPRAKTDAKMQLTMSDGSRWEFPVQIIADSRDEYYQDEKEDTIKYIRRGSLDKFEIEDWAANNMNASDVLEYMVELPSKKTELDFEEEWTNAEKEIDGKI